MNIIARSGWQVTGGVQPIGKPPSHQTACYLPPALMFRCLLRNISHNTA